MRGCLGNADRQVVLAAQSVDSCLRLSAVGLLQKGWVPAVQVAYTPKPVTSMFCDMHVSAFKETRHKAAKQAFYFGLSQSLLGYQVSRKSPRWSQMLEPFVRALRQQQHVTHDSTIMLNTNNINVSRTKNAPSSMGLALGRCCNLSQILLRRLSDSSLGSILCGVLLFRTLSILQGQYIRGAPTSY